MSFHEPIYVGSIWNSVRVYYEPSFIGSSYPWLTKGTTLIIGKYCELEPLYASQNSRT